MRWLLPVLVLTATAAVAHDADLVIVRLEPGGQPDLLLETVTLTGATLAMLAPVDADGDQALSQQDLDARHKALTVGFWDEVPLQAGGAGCARLEEQATLKEGFVELQAQWRCQQGELRQDFKILRVLPANYRVVLSGEALGTHFAQGTLTSITIPRDPPRAPSPFVPAVLAVLCVVLLLIGAWAWRTRR